MSVLWGEVERNKQKKNLKKQAKRRDFFLNFLPARILHLHHMVS